MNKFLDTYKRQKPLIENKQIIPFNKAIQNKFKQNNIIKNSENLWICSGSIIEPNVKIFSGNVLSTIGAFSYSNTPLTWGVSIGRYCSIARNLNIFGSDHFINWISTSPNFYSNQFQSTYATNELTDAIRRARNVNIEHDVWIGENISLKRQITIGTGSIVAAGAIVTKDVEPFTIVGGVPAKVIRKRFPDHIIKRILKLQWWKYHLNDLKNTEVNNPERFLDILEKKIDADEIKEYNPECLSFSSETLEGLALLLKSDNIDNHNIIFGSDFSRNYYQIYISGIGNKVHFEILLQKDGTRLCFDIEEPSLCTEEVKQTISNHLKDIDGERTFTSKKISFKVHVNEFNIKKQFRLLYTSVAPIFPVLQSK